MCFERNALYEFRTTKLLFTFIVSQCRKIFNRILIELKVTKYNESTSYPGLHCFIEISGKVRRKPGEHAAEEAQINYRRVLTIEIIDSV